jgi:8-oxo-dGTP diphosphatase
VAAVAAVSELTDKEAWCMRRADAEKPGKARMGASIIFVDPSGDVLLCLRDDKDNIPFPNCWDLLGGTVEPNETPQECIVREIQEEIRQSIEEPRLFKVTSFDDRIEYTYFQLANRDLSNVRLYEGQRLKWFSKAEIQSLPPEAIAFGFREVLLDFFDKQPWHSQKSA